MKRCPVCYRQYAGERERCPEDGSALEEVVDRLLGHVLDGRYRLEELLGKGAFGRVYRAVNLRLGDREEAVKVIALHQFTDEGRVLRDFQRETRVLGRLSERTEHIVQVYNSGEEGGLYYVAMQYLGKETLFDVIGEQAPLEVGRAVRLMRQLGEALEVAGGEGVVHLDLKLENLVVVGEGDAESLRVLDFGIARVLEEAKARGETYVFQPRGTPGYAAPEQMRWGGEVDQRADLFAAGVVFYELLTGREPWLGRPVAEGISQGEAFEHIRDPGELSPQPLPEEVPESVAQLIRWLLRKERDQRCPSARVLTKALRDLERELRPVASPPEKRDPLLGLVLAERYEVIEALEGEEDRYRVRDRGGEWEKLVVRLVRPEGDEELTDFRRRFVRRTHQIQGLTSPHLTPLLLAGQIPLESPEPGFFVLGPEPKGQSLIQVVEKEGPLGLDRALELVQQLAELLEAAHGLDPPLALGALSADTIVLAGKDADAGLSLDAVAIAAVDAGAQTPAGDLRATGRILYQMFTGQEPYLASADPASTSFPPPSNVRPALPAWIDELVDRLLVPNRQDTINTPAALAAATQKRENPPPDPKPQTPETLVVTWTFIRRVWATLRHPVSPVAAGTSLVLVSLGIVIPLVLWPTPPGVERWNPPPETDTSRAPTWSDSDSIPPDSEPQSEDQTEAAERVQPRPNAGTRRGEGTASQPRIPTLSSINAEVVGLRVYEAGPRIPARGERRYGEEVDSASARFIYYEIQLQYPQQGNYIEIPYNCTYITASGSTWHVIERSFRIRTQWTGSYHTQGVGWAEPGKWASGRYRIRCESGGDIIAEGQFVIKGQTAAWPPSGLRPITWSVSGTIKNILGWSIPNVQVSVDGMSTRTSSDSAGVFRLSVRGTVLDTITIKFGRFGYAPVERAVPLRFDLDRALDPTIDLGVVLLRRSQFRLPSVDTMPDLPKHQGDP